MPESTKPHEVTRILSALSSGSGSAAADLLPLVYEELRALAAAWFRDQPQGQTLQPTALVHEAYAKLVGGDDDKKWKNRAHFFRVAAKAMRQVLIDHARRRKTSKRAGDRERVTLDGAGAIPGRREVDIVALDEALKRLAKLDPRKSQIVEMRLFGGLTGEAIAAALDISRTTVDGDWQVARAWLRAELKDDA